MFVIMRIEGVSKADPLMGQILNFKKLRTLLWGSKWPESPTAIEDMWILYPVRTVVVGYVALPTVISPFPTQKARLMGGGRNTVLPESSTFCYV